MGLPPPRWPAAALADRWPPRIPESMRRSAATDGPNAAAHVRVGLRSHGGRARERTCRATAPLLHWLHLKRCATLEVKTRRPRGGPQRITPYARRWMDDMAALSIGNLPPRLLNAPELRSALSRCACGICGMALGYAACLGLLHPLHRSGDAGESFSVATGPVAAAVPGLNWAVSPSGGHGSLNRRRWDRIPTPTCLLGSLPPAAGCRAACHQQRCWRSA